MVTNDTSPRSGAIVVIVSYFIMFLAAIFSEFVVRQGMVVPGNAAETASNILAAQNLFRAGIAGYLLIMITDITFAWGIYVYFKNVNPSLSKLMSWSRVAYAVALAAIIVNLVTALRFVADEAYVAALGSETAQALMMTSLNTFSDGWNIAYVIFALHLFAFGLVSYKSGFAPRFLGILLMISAFTYLADNMAVLFWADYGSYGWLSTIFLIPSFFGELLFVLWLLIRGLRSTAQQAAQTA